jgi:hypothetical protein
MRLQALLKKTPCETGDLARFHEKVIPFAVKFHE